MVKTKETGKISGWAALIWLVLIVQGVAAATVDFFSGHKILLPGIASHWGAPIPWWSGVALAVVGVAILLLLRRTGQRVL